jgi:hypothetical protein
MKTYHSRVYAELCCLGSVYAIAVTAVVCLYALVRLLNPALVAWQSDPSLGGYDGNLYLPPVSEAYPTNAPIKEPTPEEQEIAKQTQIAQQAKDYTNALTRTRRQALQDLVIAVCIEVVAWPFFLTHRRMLAGVPAEEEPS